MDATETVLDRLRKAMYETDGPEHLLEAAADYGLAIVLAARLQGDSALLREARAIVDTVDALGPFRDETDDELDIEDLRAALAASPPAARRQGDPGPLRGALERADADVSLIHDFLYGRGGTMDQAHAACWRIHDVLRPQIAALTASPPEPEPLDVERLRWAIEALDDIAETDRIWRAMQPERLAAAIAEQYRAVRLSEPAQPETPE